MPTGTHPFRQTDWEYSNDDVELLLQRLGNRIPMIRLHGGETTILDPDKIRRTIDLCGIYNMPIGMLTNGYNILGLGEEHLLKMDHIVLNDHGLNENWLDYVESELRDLEEPKIWRVARHDYWDMYDVANNHPKTGRVCDSDVGGWGWIYGKIAAMMHGAIYPCCGPFFTNDIEQEMNDAGWTIYNENVEADTMSLDQLPDKFHEVCATHCPWNAITRPTINIKNLVYGRPSP